MKNYFTGAILAMVILVIVLLGYVGCNRDKIHSLLSIGQNAGTAIQVAEDGSKYIKAIYTELDMLRALQHYQDSALVAMITKQTREIIQLRQEIRIIKRSAVDSTIYVKDSSGKDMPQYTSAFKDRYLEYVVVAGPETIDLDLKVISEPVIRTEWKRPRIFAPKEPTVYVTDSNPYIETTDIKPIVLKGKKRNTGLKVAGALVFGTALGVYISH